jgi:resuscitation-promoting factor RpfA
MKTTLFSRARFSRVAAGATAVVALGIGGMIASAPANAASTTTWDKIAQCESSGNWHIDTGNGYYGGLQFSASTWRAYGGSGSAADASKSKQISVAEKVLASQGWGAWPACSSKLGLSGTSGSVRTAASVKTTSHSTKHAKHAKHVKHVHVKLSGKTYTVRSGDTMAKIASKKHVKGGWHHLAEANVSIKNPSLIFPGEKLHLPA